MGWDHPRNHLARQRSGLEFVLCLSFILSRLLSCLVENEGNVSFDLLPEMPSSLLVSLSFCFCWDEFGIENHGYLILNIIFTISF